MSFEGTNNNARNKELVLVTGLFILGLIYYAAGLIMVGIPYYSGEDTLYHLNRLIGLENVWFSPVNYNSFAGHGSLVNVFCVFRLNGTANPR